MYNELLCFGIVCLYNMYIMMVKKYGIKAIIIIGYSDRKILI